MFFFVFILTFSLQKVLANGTIEEGTVFWGAIDPRCIFKVLSSYAVIIAKIIATIAITTVIEKS